MVVVLCALWMDIEMRKFFLDDGESGLLFCKQAEGSVGEGRDGKCDGTRLMCMERRQAFVSMFMPGL